MLRVEDLSVSFGGVRALSGVSLEVSAGEAVGLIGPNGSGKTTLFNAVSGLVRRSAGRVWLGGEDISSRRPDEIARRGVARTFQNVRIFGRMTVFENVWAAQHRLAEVRAWELLLARRQHERERRQRVEHLLERLGLIDRRDALASQLPLATQRRLELARALAREPRLLLLDEPTGGLLPAETDEVARLIREVALPGRALLLIEHKVKMVASVCERIAVLSLGQKIGEGSPAEIRADPKVIEAYLGGPHA